MSVVESPKRRSARIKQDFNFELMAATANNWRPYCYGKPEEYVDYDIRPSVDAAEALCAGCPFSEGENLCLQYAIARKETWGVWGGLAFEEDSNGVGRPIKRRGRRPQIRPIAA